MGPEGNIDESAAVAALAALGQEHRLAVFRLLMQAGAAGMAAGAIAETTGLAKSTLSFHLAQLSRAGLVRQHRRDRSIVYASDCDAMNALVAYLAENCCVPASNSA
jgi:DNA-binding transcriptional ArsR family regulator